MQGRVLGFDAIAKTGAIRGTDEARYAFAADDWKGSGAPAVNDEVDFEPVANRATEIFVTRAALNFNLDRIGQTVDTEKVRTLAMPLLGSWRPALALLTILACFWTFMSAAAPGGGTLSGFSPNLFGVSTAIKQGLTGASANADIGDQIAQNGQAIAATAQNNANQISLLNVIALSLYLIPAGSVLILVQEWRRRPAAPVAFATGLLAVVLPLVLYVALRAVVGSMLKEVNDIASSLGSTGYRIDLNAGAWTVVAAGALQIAVSMGLIRGAPASFVARKPA